MKSKNVAAVLAFFLGGLGVHQFYLNRIGLGIVYLIFFWTYIPAIISFVEGIIFLTMSEEEFDRKYNNISKDIRKTSFTPKQQTHILSQNISESNTNNRVRSTKCTVCGAINEPGDKYCHNCGTIIN